MAKTFSETEYFREMIEYALRQDDYSSHAFEADGRYFGIHNRQGFYVPIAAESQDRGMNFYVPAFMHWAYKNAEFMRMTLVDESIPVRGNRWVYDIYDGCRRSNAIALNYLRYWPALPELREAMLHDFSSELREECVATIGVMGERGGRYRGDIRASIIKYHDEPYYLCEAIKALRRLEDKEAVPLLQDLYEATRARLEMLSAEETEEEEKANGYLFLLEEICTALLQFDPKAAYECLAKSVVGENPRVHHFTKRAFVLTKHRGTMKIIDSNYSAAIGFLPKDPSWSSR